jgi:hypothetical protein
VSADLIADLRNDVFQWRVSEYVNLRPKRLRDLPEFAYLKSAEVSDDLVRCAWVLYRAYKGMHHVPRGVRANDRWIQVHHHGDLATTDSDLLTRLVVAAHDAAVRVEVSPGMRFVRIMLHPRRRTDSDMTNHPCLEFAAERMRQGGPACPILVPHVEGK